MIQSGDGTRPETFALGRRAVLAAGAGAVAATVVGLAATPAQATPADPYGTESGDAGVHTAERAPGRRGFDFVDAMLDAYIAKGKTRLPQSYSDQLGLFSTAFVYDSALAALAYLAGRRVARARVIGDALLFAQANDPDHSDGRLRQGYNVGPYVFYDGTPQPDGLVRADGKANIGWQFGFLGTAVGDMAWSGLALTNLAKHTRDKRYLDGAVRIGEWIVANASTTEPLGGFKFGVDGANNKLPYTSTEHNIDLIGLFGHLARLTGDRKWLAHRHTAVCFLERMWEPRGGFFYTGTNNGIDINKSPLPEDPQSWSYLALRSRRYERSLDWAVANLTATDTPASPNSKLTGDQTFTGITFSSHSLVADPTQPISPGQPLPNPDAVWFEGTAQMACALRVRGKGYDERRVRAYMATIARAQDQLGAGQTVGGAALPERSGVVAASSPLHTGYGFGYYQFRHVGATAWFLMAAHRDNPFEL